MKHCTRLPVEGANRCRSVWANHGEVDRVEHFGSHRRVVNAKQSGIDLRRRPLTAPQPQIAAVHDDQGPRRTADLTKPEDLFHGARVYGRPSGTQQTH